MAQSSKGIRVYYGWTSDGTAANVGHWVQIPDVTSIPAMQGDPSMLDATPIDEEDQKRYIAGLKDNGGTMGYGILYTPAAIAAANAASASPATTTYPNAKRVFAVEFPAPLNRYYWYFGEGINILPGAAEVDAVLTSTFNTSIESYPVEVQGDVPDSEAVMTAFSVKVGTVTYTGTINASTGAVAISVPTGSALTNLKPMFTVSRDAVVKVNNTAQTSGETQQTFTSGTAKPYVVTSEDGATTKTYNVTITANA